MSTPEERPNPEDALAHAHAARAKMAAALNEDREPEPDEPLAWQPLWKRPRKPKSKAAKKQELRKQRRRLQKAGRRRLAAGQSRRPRSRQHRIGNAAARRDARPCPGCGTPMPGCGDDAGHRPPSGTRDALHPVAKHATEWSQPDGLHSVDSTQVRTGDDRTGARHPTMSGATSAPHPMFRTAPVRAPSATPLTRFWRVRVVPGPGSLPGTFLLAGCMDRSRR